MDAFLVIPGGTVTEDPADRKKLIPKVFRLNPD
jgi:hypothetical protein